ncbi:Phage tail protein [Streptococcus sp. DD10]|uniref:phage major tail protein, TP901-1 family n=1 Tax=Streptococcus sp. DD10 TaxID=1777878 RepID=UPI000793912F|nr:phage major tail protein, TP901-1 family [Streptococcus sp. DD10]KXT74892.1 Phage tail protein [Streptococcus sp. DD10]
MPIAKKGIDSILLFRVLSAAKTDAAAKMAFQTEHSTEKSRDANASQTKDGVLQSVGGIEVTISATSILAEDDPLVIKLESAMNNGELVEIWEIEKGATKDSSGKFAAVYYQGYITSFNKTKNSEDLVELEMEFAINGVGANGFATLTETQSAVVQYGFADTTAGSATTTSSTER